MCGRFVLLTDLSVIVESFDIQEVACEWRSGSNIAPGRNILAVIRKEDRNILVDFRWGLIPSWARDPAIGSRMFNARAETVAEKPSFKRAFRKRRCLIVADGFFEWQKSGRTRQPFYFSLRSDESFGFAGLYETWVGPARQQIHSCTIITTEPNDLIRPIHDRMPVILPKAREADWIGGHPDPGRLKSMLTPYPAEEMKMAAVTSPLKGIDPF